MAPETPDVERLRAGVFVERVSVEPWNFGTGSEIERVTQTGAFRTSDVEQMRMDVFEHLGIAQASNTWGRPSRGARSSSTPEVRLELAVLK